MSAAAEVAVPRPPAAPAVADPERLRSIVTDNFDFVWRSLVRLGVARSDADDVLQEVFLVASRKLDTIEAGRERSFLFGVALRLASRARRTEQRRREVLDGESAAHVDPTPSVEHLLDRARARTELDAILDGMPADVRAVFVLFELEQMTMAQIADVLGAAPGTVASRLRRAREHFQAAMQRLAAKGGRT